MLTLVTVAVSWLCCTGEKGSTSGSLAGAFGTATLSTSSANSSAGSAAPPEQGESSRTPWIGKHGIVSDIHIGPLVPNTRPPPPPRIPPPKIPPATFRADNLLNFSLIDEFSGGGSCRTTPQLRAKSFHRDAENLTNPPLLHNEFLRVSTIDRRHPSCSHHSRSRLPANSQASDHYLRAKAEDEASRISGAYGS